MTQIHPDLFIGTEQDYEHQVKDQVGWYVAHACKEPYHRRLLGYTTQGAPKSHPEYLWARRGNRLYLNLVDVADPAYISDDIVRATMNFIDEALAAGNKCLVHCNLGESRSPALGLLYMAHRGLIPNESLPIAEAAFIKRYPGYNPKAGMRGFLAQHWEEYTARMPFQAKQEIL